MRCVTKLLYNKNNVLSCINIGIHSFRVKAGTLNILIPDIVNTTTLFKQYPEHLPSLSRLDRVRMFTSTAEENTIAALCSLAEEPDLDRIAVRPNFPCGYPRHYQFQ
jgi:hypothetical protein